MAIEPWWAIKASFTEHRKIDELMNELSLDRDQAIGKIIRIWRWVRLNAVFGVIEGRNIEEKIAGACDWKGDAKRLLDTLVKVRWFDKRPDGTFFVHDWDDHNFALIKGEEQRERNRAQTRDRQRRYKARERQAQQNRYKSDPSAKSYSADSGDALPNGSVTRYPTVGGKKMDKKDASKNLSKSTLFEGDALATRDLTGEVTGDRLLNYAIKHPLSRIIDYYLAEYKRVRQEEYIGPRDRMARNVKDLKRDYDEEEIARRIHNYFESTDPYYVEKVKFDWATFYSQFNRLGAPVHKDNNSQQRSKDNGYDKPKGTETTIDDFQ